MVSTLTARSSVLKQMSAMAAISAATTIFPGMLFAKEEQEIKLQAALATANFDITQIAWKKVSCDLCAVPCGLLVSWVDEKTIAVKGDLANPMNQGLCCAKGYQAVRALYMLDRHSQADVMADGEMIELPVQELLDAAVEKRHEAIPVSVYSLQTSPPIHLEVCPGNHRGFIGGQK